jgi:CRP-like cAMP-binding protein
MRNLTDRSKAAARLTSRLGLSADDQCDAELLSHFEIEFAAAASALFVDRATDPRLCLVIDGFVRHEWSAPRRPDAVAVVYADDDWFEVQRSADRPAQTIAIRDSWVASVKTADLSRSLADAPDAACHVVAGLAKALHSANRFARDLALKDSPGRIAALLLDLERRFGRHEGCGVVVEHSLRQSDIARAAGCTRETATRVLGDFQRRGVLTKAPGTFVLHDRDWLVMRAR